MIPSLLPAGFLAPIWAGLSHTSGTSDPSLQPCWSPGSRLPCACSSPRRIIEKAPEKAMNGYEAAVADKPRKISVTNLSGGRLADPASESGIEVLRS